MTSVIVPHPSALSEVLPLAFGSHRRRHSQHGTLSAHARRPPLSGIQHHQRNRAALTNIPQRYSPALHRQCVRRLFEWRRVIDPRQPAETQ